MEPDRIVHPRPSRRVPVDPDRLAAVIKEQDLSVREVARRTNMTAPHLVMVLNGKSGISEAKLRKLAGELGVPYGSLLAEDAA